MMILAIVVGAVLLLMALMAVCASILSSRISRMEESGHDAGNDF